MRFKVDQNLPVEIAVALRDALLVGCGLSMIERWQQTAELWIARFARLL